MILSIYTLQSASPMKGGVVRDLAQELRDAAHSGSLVDIKWTAQTFVDT